MINNKNKRKNPKMKENLEPFQNWMEGSKKFTKTVPHALAKWASLLDTLIDDHDVNSYKRRYMVFLSELILSSNTKLLGYIFFLDRAS